MNELHSTTSSLPRELASDLQGLLTRVDSLIGRVEEESGAGEYLEELAEAIRDVGETRQQLVERAAYFEQLMGDERRRYHDLFDRAPDAYVVTSLAGLILEANHAASELFGRSPNDLLGKPLPVFVAPESRREFRQRLLWLSRRSLEAFDVEIDARSGRRHVEARASAEAVDERPLRLRWILRDVTERKTAEETVRLLNAELEGRIEGRTRELADTTARLESVLQEMPQGVIIVDASGNVQTANRRAEELTGLTKEQLGNIIDARPWQMYGRDGRELDEDERPLVRALATGAPVAAERLRFVRRDGTTLYVDFAATPVHGADGVDAVIVTFQDVTSQELRERAERDFITNASHELQTPIAAITSAIEVLQAGAKDRPADRERFLSHIARACDRLTRLTHALLVLARAQTGDERPRSDVIPVESLLESVRESLGREREIEIDCAHDLAVVGNRPLLEQAIFNLAHNAIKYTAGPVRIDAAANDGHVAIVVRDSGGGIPAADRERVVERFYRHGAGEAGGFGLGLAIVAEVARALDGELTIDSSDRGTSVALSLPAARLVST